MSDKDIDPIDEDSPLINLPPLKAQPPNTITLGAQVSTYEFGVGHKHAVHSTAPDRLTCKRVEGPGVGFNSSEMKCSHCETRQ